MTANGSVVTWVRGPDGGDCSKAKAYLTSSVEFIYSHSEGNDLAFAAVKDDHTIVVWGYEIIGSGAAKMVCESVGLDPKAAIIISGEK